MGRGRAVIAALSLLCAPACSPASRAMVPTDARAGTDGEAPPRDGDAEGDESATGPRDAAVDAACDGGCFEPCPGALPEKGGLTLDDMMRIFFVGFTEVRVHFCNPLMATQPPDLVFFAELQSHKGIPPSSLTYGTWLVNDAGVEVTEGLVWEGSDLGIGEHHAGGTLTVPPVSADGTPILDDATTMIELHADAIGDQGYDAFFRWTEEYLP